MLRIRVCERAKSNVDLDPDPKAKFVNGKPAPAETGRVLSIGDGIARVYGLKNIQV
jgi:hypothetical protein